jgi:hypothetical protein
MNLLKFIHIPTFALSILFGLILVYIFNQNQIRKIYVYPTPENVKKLQYKDATNNCFEFRQKEVNCPLNKDNISTIPVQS